MEQHIQQRALFDEHMAHWGRTLQTVYSLIGSVAGLSLILVGMVTWTTSAHVTDDASHSMDTTIHPGWMVVVGIVILVYAYIYYWFTQHSDFAARMVFFR